MEVPVGKQPGPNTQHGPSDLLDAVCGVRQHVVGPAHRVAGDDVGDRRGAGGLVRAVVGQHDVCVAARDRRLHVLLKSTSVGHQSTPSVSRPRSTDGALPRATNERPPSSQRNPLGSRVTWSRTAIGRRLPSSSCHRASAHSASSRSQFSWFPVTHRSSIPCSAHSASMVSRYPSGSGPYPNRRSPSWKATSTSPRSPSSCRQSTACFDLPPGRRSARSSWRRCSQSYAVLVVMIDPREPGPCSTSGSSAARTRDG